MTSEAAGCVWSSSRQPRGLHNPTIYVTHVYHTAVNAANTTGFRISHVSVRAWAFLGGSIGSMVGLSRRGHRRAGLSVYYLTSAASALSCMCLLIIRASQYLPQVWLDKRVFNYLCGSTRSDLLMVANCTDFAVTDNDLIATWTGVEVHNSDHGRWGATTSGPSQIKIIISELASGLLISIV